MTSNPLRRSPALWWWLGGLAALCLAACVVTLGTPSLAQLQQAQRQLADAYGRHNAVGGGLYRRGDSHHAGRALRVAAPGA